MALEDGADGDGVLTHRAGALVWGSVLGLVGVAPWGAKAMPGHCRCGDVSWGCLLFDVVQLPNEAVKIAALPTVLEGLQQVAALALRNTRAEGGL
ncbi:MAG: hypothetical protein FWD63_05170 [Propionibacteriaceae bacterium]|nr:hypothetical protein [Propionibacteriaceae bacterium]